MKSLKSFALSLLVVLGIGTMASAQNFDLVPIESLDFDQSVVIPEDMYEIVGEACDDLAVQYIIDMNEDILSYNCYYVDRFAEDHEDYLVAIDEALMDDGYGFVAEFTEYGYESDLYMQRWDALDGTFLELIYTFFDENFIMLAVRK
jgi:hypothetical protein